ncbi:MAG TPA: sorbosone dehydrogenase family protein [Polyangia bacterium]|nr:sorbosone dehydrogenase family protein [Polyangia bacterium]
MATRTERPSRPGGWAWALALALTLARPASAPAAEPFVDFRGEGPATMHHVRVVDLPAPNVTASADNSPHIVSRPKDAWPQAPAGFRVQLYAQGMTNPRFIRVAPNGDVFVTESKAGTIQVFRGVRPDGRAASSTTFATGLRRPFGLAFFPPTGEPQWLYVANTDSVARFVYRTGDLRARSPEQTLAPLPGGGFLRGGGHWTRDVAFSLDGQKMFVSVGSRSNNDDTDGNRGEEGRADILEFKPDGSDQRVYAWGLRNAVGIAVHPVSGELWASVNERDDLGDNLPPDYITRVQPGGFYGWPWFYIGDHQDPRHKGKHQELREKVIVPDVLLQPHAASLQMTFYDGKQFPEAYRGDIFAANHGSWNRSVRTGYVVVRVPLHGTPRASGEYEDFLTGFVTRSGDVWGRPVGVAVAGDGALLVTDDASNCIWRVVYEGAGKAP